LKKRWNGFRHGIIFSMNMKETARRWLWGETRPGIMRVCAELNFLPSENRNGISIFQRRDAAARGWAKRYTRSANKKANGFPFAFENCRRA
jgi:hypothetical protein